MILRRMADAIRKQEWFTVIIEILIVVIGIFLGLQATEWNDKRKDHILEKDYLSRLLVEIHIAAPSIQYRFSDKSKITEDLRDVVRYFHDLPGKTILTSLHCRAIQHSHRFSDPEADLPVVSELIATGNLDLITNKNIKTAVTALLLSQEQRVDILRDIQSQRAVLSSEFADLIAFSTDPEDIDSNDDFGHKCDFKSMRDNQLFKNRLLDNISRNGAYMAFWGKEMNALNTLHQLVDDASDFTHE